MYMGRVPGRVAAFLLRPPGWLLHGLLAIVVLVVLYACSMPGLIFIPAVFGVLAAVCLGVIWLVRFTTAAILVARFRVRILQPPGAGRRWATVPVCLVGVAILLVTRVPLYVTFWISRSATDRLAAELTQPSFCYYPNANRRLGVYSVDRVETITGGMRFLVKGTGFMDQEGFAYSPNGPPQAIGEDYYTHFSGPWYLWRESW
jgi:hypothetical protein